VVVYLAGALLAAHHAPHALVAGLMALVFLLLVAAMYLRLLPALLALPLLAVLLASLAGMPWQDICSKVMEEGGMRLKTAILAVILGSVLAQVVEKTGIAATAVKKTAELGGDRPIMLAAVLTVVIAVLFTTLSGLGGVIMVATIVIPILLSLGLRPLYVGCLFLLAMSLGGAFNLANWELYKTTLHMTNSQILPFAAPFGGVMLIAIVCFMLIEGKRMGKARYKAVVSAAPGAQEFVPWYALLTPVAPLIPVLLFALLPRISSKVASYDFPISVALLIGIVYGAITTWKRGQSTAQLLTKSTFDGIAAVGPALALMVGIGMVLIATMSPEVSAIMQPVLSRIMPHGHAFGAVLWYVILFTVLAPLALYRGPLNLYGMGAGLIGALQGIMPTGAIMAAFTAVGMVQGVCDPTNTQNVWIANYTNTDVQDILKRTLPYMWALTLVGLVLGAVLYYR
jgi:H+/gluconate symporter-like permease